MAAKKYNKHSDSYVKEQKKVDFSLVETLLNIINDSRDNLIVSLIAQTGLSPDEVVKIKFEDINFENNTIIIKSKDIKNKAQKTISLSQNLSLQLKNFVNKNKRFVFSSNKSPRLRTRSISKIFEKYSKILGIKITSSNLRNLYVQNLISKETSVEKIKNSLGLKRLDEKKFLSIEDYKKIRTSIQNKRDQLLFDILFYTGCQLSELTNIKIKDIEFTTNSIKFSSDKKRISTISKNLSLQIKSFVNENNLSKNDFLFSTRQDVKISDKRVFQIIKKYSTNRGLTNISPQTLRYSHIAYSLSIGKSIEEISKQTGIQNLDKFHLYGVLRIKNE